MRVVTMVRILLSLALAAMALPALAQSAFKPVAVVNDSAVTGYDLAQRERILGVMGFSAPSQEAISRQALQSLIEERLKVQEAERLGIELSDEMVTAGLSELAQRFNLTPISFRERMQADGVTPQAIDDLIGAEALWREVIRARFLRRSEPSEAAIDAELSFIGTDAGRFRMRELRIPVAEGANATEVTQEVNQVFAELQNGLPIEQAIAR
ncbi:MAG: SurA N-terminal domain-containing protein, partial [Pseudomonadota bacterium]